MVFLSDKSDDEENTNFSNNNKFSYKGSYANREAKVEDQENVSKIKMNYFNKGSSKLPQKNQPTQESI